MINGREEFFAAVEIMRQYRKEFSRANSPFARNQAQRKEAEVDACIERGRQKQADAKQNNLPLGG